MKKIFYITIISLAVLYTSCDYVANPYPAKNTNISDTTSCSISAFPAVVSHIRKILIEDFTAHTCTNCPKAARSIHIVDSTYLGQINTVAVHCSSLAAPSPSFDVADPGSYMDDYRTNVGTTYDNSFGASAYGLPEAMINRRDYDTSTLAHLKLYPFSSYVAGIIAESSVVDLQINLNYDASTRKICCAIRDSFLTAVTGNYKLVALITQDSIISWQDDADHNPANVSNYIFNHVLRDAITPTGASGEPLIIGGASAGLKQIRHFAYTIPAAYKNINCIPKNCHIVAFIYNTTTHEVIQSEDAKVIH